MEKTDVDPTTHADDKAATTKDKDVWRSAIIRIKVAILFNIAFLQQSTSSAPDTGPTTAWTVPPSGNTEAHPTSTKQPAPDSPGIDSPQRIKQDIRMQSTSSAPCTGPTTASLVPSSGNTDTHPTERTAPESPATASPRSIQQDTSMQSTSSAPCTGPTTASLVPPSGNTDTHPTERTAPESPATASPRSIQQDTSMAWLGDLVVEAVFPTAGFIRLHDCWVIGNKECLEMLHSDNIGAFEDFEGVSGRALLAGSTAEGVAMEDGWGFPLVDHDRMILLGIDLVHTREAYVGGINLIYNRDGCPPAYTFLEVKAEERDEAVSYIKVLQIENKQDYEEQENGDHGEQDHSELDQNEEVLADKCVQEKDGCHWLMSSHLRDALKAINAKNVKGPATVSSDGLIEWVTALVIPTSHPDMAAYSKRTRVWPTEQQIKDLNLQTILVCVGPKGHEYEDFMFRASFSPHELKLMMDLDLKAKQGYICLKFIMKALMTGSQADDHGRSHVSSYHMKTLFLRYLEKHGPQETGSPFNLALELCHELQQCLDNGNIPHYFITECNLLEQVKEKQRQEAHEATVKALYDPVAAIIKSPSNPEQIFGSRDRQVELLRCCRAVSDQPASGAALEKLRQLLDDLDDHRLRMYNEQLKEDDRVDFQNGHFFSDRKSRRHGLVVLTDFLPKNI